MHGAVWVGSPLWPLVAKMGGDFTEASIARLERGDGIPVESNESRGSVKGTIYVANSVADSLETSEANTSSALNTANEQTGNALSKSAKATAEALKKSAKAVGRFLHMDGGEEKKNATR